MIARSNDKMIESGDQSALCPLCWGAHNWTESHEIVAIVPRSNTHSFIAALSRFGLSWPRGYDPLDPEERSYGELRMVDLATLVGLSCDAVGDRWFITRAKAESHARTAA